MELHTSPDSIRYLKCTYSKCIDFIGLKLRACVTCWISTHFKKSILLGLLPRRHHLLPQTCLPLLVPPSQILISPALLPTFPDSLPSLLTNISGYLSSPSGLSYHHKQLCPSFLYLHRASPFPLPAPCLELALVPLVSLILFAAWGQACFSRAHGVRTWPPSNLNDKH